MKQDERHYVNMQVNPCKMCMPMGGSMALKGIKKTMTIIHGSQGCSTYIRRHMAAHYHEPVDIASSSLSEEGTVYGGASNLKIGIKNMVEMYEPEVVGVLTSCLAETIGDDITRIVKEVRKDPAFEHVDIIPIPTPGYGGSQSEGYFGALRAILQYYDETTDHLNDIDYNDQPVNIIVSNATCEDIRELKKITGLFGIGAIFFPDISDVLDAPYKKDYEKLNTDGTSREDIKRMLNAKATIELGNCVAMRYSPGAFLFEAHDIPLYRLPLPIGVSQTDALIEALCGITGKEIPSDLVLERGRLLDAMIDSHKHSALGRVALFGDMDLVYGISGLLLENGMELVCAATGTESKIFREAMVSRLESYEQKAVIMQDSDFDTIREVIKEEEANIMIGNSNGRFIWEKDGIDFVRVGFPIHDHMGAQRKKRMGYKGAVRLLDEVVNHLLDQKHKNYRQRMYDTYYKEIESVR